MIGGGGCLFVRTGLVGGLCGRSFSDGEGVAIPGFFFSLEGKMGEVPTSFQKEVEEVVVDGEEDDPHPEVARPIDHLHRVVAPTVICRTCCVAWMESPILRIMIWTHP